MWLNRGIEMLINNKISHDIKIQALPRVIRGVGGWFIRPKKCLTPSGDESSGNRLKIWQIPIQT